MPNVKLPNGQIVHFPDDMSPELITSEIEKTFGKSMEFRQGQPETLGQKIKRGFSEYEKPIIEMVGLTAGGLAGVPFTIPTAGTAPLAGAGLGYAIGKKTGEIIESGLGYLAGERPAKKRTIGQEIEQSGKDIVTGAAYQAGGALAGKYVFEPLLKGGKWVFNLFNPKADTRIVNKAAKQWMAHTSQGPIYAENQQKAKELQEKIPGLKFTYGQQTFDPRELALERGQFRRTGITKQRNAEQIAQNDLALKNYYDENFPQGTGIDDFLSVVQERESLLGKGVETAKKGVETALTKYPQGEPAEISGRLLKVLRQEEKHVGKEASKLYEGMPNPQVSIAEPLEELEGKSLYDRFKELQAPTAKIESPENIPKSLKRFLEVWGPKEQSPKLKELVSAYEKIGKSIPDFVQKELDTFLPAKEIPFHELRGTRTEIMNELRESVGRTTGRNYSKEGRLKQMLKAVETTLDQMADSSKYGEEAATQYRIASAAWKNYRGTYEKGTVGDIMQAGSKGEATRLTPEQAIQRLFSTKDTQAADQLIQAIGKEKATGFMTEYGDYLAIKNAINPVTKEVNRGALLRWASQNKSILKKYGIQDRYLNLAKSQEAVETALKNKEVFEKSQAVKMLNVDPEKAISVAFSGKGGLNSKETMATLVGLTKGNPAAEQGLKKAFADHALSQSEDTLGQIWNTRRDIMDMPTASVAKFQKLWTKFAPGIKILYPAGSKERTALLNIKHAYETAIRNQMPVTGGGSDTAENASQITAMIVGPLAQTSRMATAAKASVAFFRNHDAKKVNLVLDRAIFDPEYAETLEMLGRGWEKGSKETLAFAKKRFTSHILAVSGLAGQEIKEDIGLGR